MTSIETRPDAYIKHQLPGRVRLKIPQKKGDDRYFDCLAELFADCPGITQLQFNPQAASILICHSMDTGFSTIAEFAQTKGLFTIIEQPPEEMFSIPHLPIATLTSAELKNIDKSLLNFSQGWLDGRSLLFLALVGLAVSQINKGRFMVPAASLLWYAITLLKEENEKIFDLDRYTRY